MNFMTWLELYQFLTEFQGEFEVMMDVLNDNRFFEEDAVLVFKTWLAAEDVVKLMIAVVEDVIEEKKGEHT